MGVREMYSAIIGFLIILAALGIWLLLKRTRLRLPARILLTLLLTAAAAVVLIWGSVCISILLYQLNDPIGW